MGEPRGIVKQLAQSLGYEAETAAELLAQFQPEELSREPYIWRA